jgi:hypothetical protein
VITFYPLRFIDITPVHLIVSRTSGTLPPATLWRFTMRIYPEGGLDIMPIKGDIFPEGGLGILPEETQCSPGNGTGGINREKLI